MSAPRSSTSFTSRPVQATLAARMPQDEVDVPTTASVGIAFSGQEDAEQLVAHADTAMYRAKQLGRARGDVYDEDVREPAARRPLMERTLRAAPVLS
ncbi:MAG: diguanylate cyclase domain-containing protein [Frankiaceae bacterium]